MINITEHLVNGKRLTVKVQHRIGQEKIYLIEKDGQEFGRVHKKSYDDWQVMSCRGTDEYDRVRCLQAVQRHARIETFERMKENIKTE